MPRVRAGAQGALRRWNSENARRQAMRPRNVRHAGKVLSSEAGESRTPRRSEVPAAYTRQPGEVSRQRGVMASAEMPRAVGRMAARRMNAAALFVQVVSSSADRRCRAQK